MTESALAIAQAIRDGQISASLVTIRCLERIEQQNPKLNAFSAITRERALREAAAVDAARAAGQRLGALAGVPYAVKNLFDIATLPTLAGSKINADNPPATEDAHLIKRMAAAGAVLVGALHMGEYAYDFTGENIHYGDCCNPLDPGHMAGGSSSGCGAAVGGDLVPLALGSDTNGSIRVPSAFCGIYGLKPTYGRLGRSGTFPFVASLDHLGPFARNLPDLAATYAALQGEDPADSGWAPPPPNTAESHPLRVAVLGGYFRRGGQPEVYAAVDHVAQLLGANTMVDLPEAARARAGAYVITAAEGAHLHLSRLRTRSADFDPPIRQRLLAGAATPAAWVIKAQKFRRWFQLQAQQLFKQYDILLAPATPFSAPLRGTTHIDMDGQSTPVRPNVGIYTQPISFIGLPVISIPVFGFGKLPLGVQIIAPPWREDLAFRAAGVVTGQTDLVESV